MKEEYRCDSYSYPDMDSVRAYIRHSMIQRQSDSPREYKVFKLVSVITASPDVIMKELP